MYSPINDDLEMAGGDSSGAPFKLSPTYEFAQAQVIHHRVATWERRAEHVLGIHHAGASSSGIRASLKCMPSAHSLSDAVMDYHHAAACLPLHVHQ